MAILLAVSHWCAYLQLKEFTIFTDQRIMISLYGKRLHTPWQQRFQTLVQLFHQLPYCLQTRH
jgi:hypothetical protein